MFAGEGSSSKEDDDNGYLGGGIALAVWVLKGGLSLWPRFLKLQRPAGQMIP